MTEESDVRAWLTRNPHLGIKAGSLDTPSADARRKTHSSGPVEREPDKKRLVRACKDRWPHQRIDEDYRAVWETHRRKYELDIAFPALMLGILVHGWRNHGGMTPAKMHTDCEAMRLFQKDGWRVLPFMAMHVAADIDSVMAEIAEVVEWWRDYER